MMDMVVHFSDREIILFSFWKTGTLSGLLFDSYEWPCFILAFSSLNFSSQSVFEGMAVSMLITFLLCILYEAVKGFRLFLAYCHLKESRASNRSSSPLTDSREFCTSNFSLPRRVFSGFRLVQAALFGVQSLLAYVLMLIVMTFNGNLILSVVLGEAVGYLLFTGTPFLDAYVLDCC
uniref:Copper transport protein n=1 Tax=Angiostrongylus cantonensis TaxID=6313 RepID=A0A0K0DMX0_ANGCA